MSAMLFRPQIVKISSSVMWLSARAKKASVSTATLPVDSSFLTAPTATGAQPELGLRH